MNRMFYLSIVYDINGYNRLDLEKRARLQELDELIAQYKNNDEIKEHYPLVKKNKGRLCIIYEDLDEKKRELDEYRGVDESRKKELREKFSYAHTIPIIPSNERLLTLETCILLLNIRMRDHGMIDRIMGKVKTDKNKPAMKLNDNVHRDKKYIFESDDEKYSLNTLSDEYDAVDRFLERIKHVDEDTLYFYARTLMVMRGLTTKKKVVTHLTLNEKELLRLIKKRSIYDSTIEEDLEEESKNMDDFYIRHDLDEVIKYSPNSNRPIGSEGRKKK